MAEETPVLISNAEVLDILGARVAEAKASKKRPSYRTRHRDWIQSQVCEYLRATPCTRLDRARRKELQTVLRSHKRRVSNNNNSNDDSNSSTNGTTVGRGFQLTEAEALQVLNFMPTEPVEIHLMIEDLHARMPEKDQEELLRIVASYRKDELSDASNGVKREKGDPSSPPNGTMTTSPVVKKEYPDTGML
jgi:hypothetical protein|uniref:DNA-directed RNA polymerase III subunit RPC9 n=1 Tax=Phaeodactylum tricornutum TaxID=2850 RepID=A0A8J9SEZ4_PHATR